MPFGVTVDDFLVKHMGWTPAKVEELGLRELTTVVDASTFDRQGSDMAFRLRERRLGLRRKKMCPMVITPSRLLYHKFGSINDPQSGRVNFALVAGSNMSKNDAAAEYGGEVEHDRTKNLEKLARGEDTHMRSAGFMDFVIDGSEHGQFTKRWLVETSRVGAYANDADGLEDVCGVPLRPNARYYEDVASRSAFHQPPYVGAPWVGKRVYILVNRDIAIGEEILVSYGGTYKGRHLTSGTEEDTT